MTTLMPEAEFLALYQGTLRRIEEMVEAAINDDDAAIDYESGNDMLTLSFSNRSVVIISRQTAIRQLWLAARSGGFHYDYDSSRRQWICSANGETLTDMLQAICRDQGGVTISFG